MRVPDFDSADNALEPGAQQKEDALNNLADQIRSIWIDCMKLYHLKTTGRVYDYRPGPRLDGGSDMFGSTFKPIWSKLTKFILDHNLRPRQFIKAQFTHCRGSPPISPNMLMSQNCISRYTEFINDKEAENELRLAKDIQVRTADNELHFKQQMYLDKKDAYRSLIMDETISITALFRYSLAIVCNFDDLAKIWFEPALMQYIEDVELYDLVWKDLIPSDIKVKAHNIVGGQSQ